MPDHSRASLIASQLASWFRREARDLPWRRHRSPYTALISETMLQQTQVARVIEKFDSFIARFPNVESLAAAPLDDVLAHWQGLGYYRRARNLHAAAKAIVAQYGGCVPATVDELRALPGIGRYTAGAIASIAFNQPEPIVDGNVHRVLARLNADDRPPTDRQAIHDTWQRAGEIAVASTMIRKTGPAIVNEALMELGATICTPRSPRCDACPLQSLCKARQLGVQATIPPAKTAAPSQAVHHHALLIERKGRILLEQRSAQIMWAGLWQPPTVESARKLRLDGVRSRCQLPLESLKRLGAFDFATTHRQITFHVFRGTLMSRARVQCDSIRWFDREEVTSVAVSSAHRKVLAWLERAQRTKSVPIKLGRV